MKARAGVRRRGEHSAPAPLARILVTTDFSTGASKALQRAALLAGASGGELHLLHVEPPDRPAADGEKARRALSSAMTLIRQAALASGARRLRLVSSLRAGEPYVEIIRCAREIGAELIVMGRGAPTALRRRVVGTTAARVVRMSDVPTLLVARRPRGPYRRALVAVEIDPAARDLIRLTGRIVRGHAAAALRIVHVYRVPFESYYRASRDRSGAVYFREGRKAAANALAAMLQAAGVRAAITDAVLRRGDARAAIPSEALRWRADLVALGTHGRSGMSHMLMGSVAESVIASTLRDVLVARPVRFTFVPP